MPRRPVLEQALGLGLTYLDKAQRDDGGFDSYSSLAGQPFEAIRKYQTAFVPSVMLAALAAVDMPEAMPVRDRLSKFLLSQKGPSGAFNYWSKSAPERKQLTYPDDLDDTFCAYIGLYLHDPSLVSASLLAQIVKLLLATESQVGGPYRTWLVSSDSDKIWLDVDVAVNANIAYFLSLVSSLPPGLQNLMSRVIRNRQLESPYYPSVYPIVYYLSRAYQGAEQRLLLSRVRGLQRPKEMTSLDRSLCLTARLRLGDTHDPSVTVDRLLAAQRSDGSWPAAAFCLDPMRAGQAHANGCEALTTALVCETLQLCLKSRYESTAPGIDKSTLRRTDQPARILRLAKRQCQTLSPELRRTLLRLLTAQSDGDTGSEIINMAQRLSESLATATALPSKRLLETLSLANLYGWAAYTVYDDFLDDEGHPELLSAANVAMRLSVRCFSDALTFHRPYQALVRQVFDTIDGANAWEQAHCRLEHRGDSLVVGKLPDYGSLGQLAERSLGHALPAMAVLLSAGVEYDSPDFDNLRRSLRHYLIARQLNDDLHDWEQDLARGRATYVVGHLLAAGPAARPGVYRLATLIAGCRQHFWHSTLPQVCRIMERQVVAARQALQAMTILKADNLIANLLTGIELSIDETLAKQSEAQAFLKSYGERLGV